MYCKKYFLSNKNNPAKIWDAIHELVDLKSKSNITLNRLMKENGDFVEEPKDDAQLQNKFFVDIGKNMAFFLERPFLFENTMILNNCDFNDFFT